ncbi:MAG TPA: hypothetical protein VH482_16645 [Thermomicrobiales bacterium]|jgi:hypothetical protein
MRAFGLIGRVAIGVMLLAGTVALSPGSAAAATGSITLHVRLCPAGQPTTDIFTDCHSHLAGADVAFKINGHGSKTVNSRGNIKFSGLTGGTRTITQTGGQTPNEFLHMRAFCSVPSTGEKATEHGVGTDSLGRAFFRYRLATGAQAVCDVYFVPESGKGA